MERWIEHLADPMRLLLCWRPPTKFKPRTRWVVGVLERVGGNAQFRYLHGSDFSSRNDGRTERDLADMGFRGYPAFKWRSGGDGDPYTSEATEAFLRRLPPRHRSDFTEYLCRFFVRPGSRISSFALLAATGARSPHDGFSLVDPFEEDVERRDVVLEVRGYHYYHSEADGEWLDREVMLSPEPTNPHDPNAIQVKIDGRCIGYISRFQNVAVARWLRNGEIHAWLVRINGSLAEPSALLFVRVSLPERELAA